MGNERVCGLSVNVQWGTGWREGAGGESYILTGGGGESELVVGFKRLLCGA